MGPHPLSARRRRSWRGLLRKRHTKLSRRVCFECQGWRPLLTRRAGHPPSTTGATNDVTLPVGLMRISDAPETRTYAERTLSDALPLLCLCSNLLSLRTSQSTSFARRLRITEPAELNPTKLSEPMGVATVVGGPVQARTWLRMLISRPLGFFDNDNSLEAVVHWVSRNGHIS